MKKLFLFGRNNFLATMSTKQHNYALHIELLEAMVEESSLNVHRIFVNHHLDPNQILYTESPMLMALQVKSPKIVQYLVSQGGDVEASLRPWWTKSEVDFLEFIRWMDGCGVTINYESPKVAELMVDVMLSFGRGREVNVLEGINLMLERGFSQNIRVSTPNLDNTDIEMLVEKLLEWSTNPTPATTFITHTLTLIPTIKTTLVNTLEERGFHIRETHDIKTMVSIKEKLRLLGMSPFPSDFEEAIDYMMTTLDVLLDEALMRRK